MSYIHIHLQFLLSPRHNILLYLWYNEMGDDMKESDKFSQRLLQLMNKNKLSARQLSLSLGYNEGYINRIVNGKTYPNVINFFEICEFLEITPKEFFDYDIKNPILLNENIKELKKLNDNALNHHLEFLKEINKK